MLDQDVNESLHELRSALHRYNALILRVSPDYKDKLAFLTMASDYDLETEVIKEADQKSCVKSISRTVRFAMCSDEKLCMSCKWNNRRKTVLDKRDKMVREVFVGS